MGQEHRPRGIASMDVIFNIIHVFQYYILPFVIVLGIMIFFHELGHFLVAKYFGVKVLKFALGFGPVLVGKTIGETEYSVRYFPLGGFVKMLGEEIEDDEDEVQDLSPEEEGKSFSNKHPLKRMAIVTAGPLFNLILALFLYCGFFYISGDSIILPEIGQVSENTPAHKAGFLKGDVITAINGIQIEGWSEVIDNVRDKAGILLTVAVMRDGQPMDLTVMPEEKIIKDEFGKDVKISQIGIMGKQKNIELGLWQAVEKGFDQSLYITKLTFFVIGKLFQGDLSIKTLGGPILIGQMTGKIVKENIGYVIPFMAIISINLGILNLLPIPILDGGLIIFLLLELLIGKPLSVKKREFAFKVGLTLLILLMLIVTYNDISRLIKECFG